MKLRTLILVPGLLAAGLILAGCTAAPAGPDPAETESAAASLVADFNSSDVMFAQMMVPHHAQAIEMSNMILDKDGIDPRVVELAEEIEAAQQPEIDQLNAMLEAWGEPPAATGGTGMDHGQMDGMMTEEDMAALEAATGVEASRLFLEQMILHHEGAVEMAQTEVESGANPDAVAMAQDIIDAQTGEIETMREILQSL